MERTTFGLLFYIRRNKLNKSLTLASGATIENVAKILGHADTKMTRHYARILDSSILRDMQIVAKKMAS